MLEADVMQIKCPEPLKKYFFSECEASKLVGAGDPVGGDHAV